MALLLYELQYISWFLLNVEVNGPSENCPVLYVPV
jgi:hypothetical protein